MVEKKRIRPRSLEGYSEEVRQSARAAFIAFSFIERMSPERAAPYIANVNNGDYDDMPMLQMAAFIINSNGKRVDAGVKCTGCGSSWTDDRLAEEQNKRREDGGPPLLSCCPERKMKPVFWCDHASV